jgi:hypothetical protein
MKTTWKKGALALTIIFAVGFKADDVVELQQYLNGRGTPNFLSSAGNVKFTLPKGTKAKVVEAKNFYSGNAGLYVEVLDGARKGEKVWIYHNKKNPGMELYASEDANPQSQKARDVASAKSVKTTREQPAFKASGEEGSKEISKADFDALNKKIEKAQKETKKLDPPCTSNCEMAAVTYSAEDVSKMDAPFIVKPTKTDNPNGIRGAIITDPRCGMKLIPVAECNRLMKEKPALNYYNLTPIGDQEVSAFALSERKVDRDKNSIEPKGRDWTFSFENQATQDIYFAVSDLSGVDKEGRVLGTDSYYLLFPRVSLPTVRETDGRIIVTLPTGETVSYDSATKKPINGVLKETSAKGTSNIAYTGKGLMIRVDGQGDDPRRSSKATVIKNGKVCKVPASEFWSPKNEALHFKYGKDTTLNSFLMKSCGKDFNF